MVYGHGRKHVSWHANWNGYLYADFNFDIDVQINDTKTNMHCVIQNLWANFTPGSSHGWGFVNVGAFAWSLIPFDARYPKTGRLESWDLAWSQCVQASGGQVANRTIWGCFASDDAGARVRGTIGGVYAFDFPLGPGNFNGSGQLNGNFNLVNYWSRYYDNYGSPPARVQSGLNFAVNASDLEWDYFPFAVMSNGTWYSCNRPGGFVQVAANGGWVERKNGKPSGDEVFVWNGGWRQAPKIGAGG